MLDVLLVLGAALPGALLQGALAEGPDGLAAYGARIAATERAHAECRWSELAEVSREVRELNLRGDDDWLISSAMLGEALHELWTSEAREELLAIGRDTLAFEVEWSRRNGGRPLASRSRDGPLVAFHVGELRAYLADALHHEGSVVEAFGHRALAAADLGAGPPQASPLALQETLLAEAGDLLALGRGQEARARLVALRDAHPRSIQASIATALLAGSDPLSAYAGDLRGDPRLAARTRELTRAIPAARRRVAQWLGHGGPLPAVAIGIADPPGGLETYRAFTRCQPRRPELRPAVVFHAHQVALGTFDFETVLVHELSHAVLWAELGVAYERLPSWVHEGLARSVAGELERIADTVLSNWIQDDAAQFQRPTLLEERGITLDVASCHASPSLEAQLAGGLYLEAHGGGPGAPRIVEALLSGVELEEALLALSGHSLAEAVETAERLGHERLEARWREVVPSIREVERLAREHPLAFVADLYRRIGESSPELARELAFRRRAEILERMGATAQAAGAWREAFELVGPGFDALWLAQVSEVRCLLSGADEAETRELLERLHREALRSDVRAWAAAQLAAREAGAAGGDPR